MLNKIHDKIPIISLILLSPLIAELLSGSAPPIEFFNPISYFLFSYNSTHIAFHILFLIKFKYIFCFDFSFYKCYSTSKIIKKIP